MRGGCLGGKNHGEVLTAADDVDGRYDPSVLVALGPPRPNGHQWGYCADCRQGFRWSVGDQRWRPWPGGRAQLPHLSDEELDALGATLRLRITSIEATLAAAQSPGVSAENGYLQGLLWSLHTAVAEARNGLWPVDGDVEWREPET